MILITHSLPISTSFFTIGPNQAQSFNITVNITGDFTISSYGTSSAAVPLLKQGSGGIGGIGGTGNGGIPPAQDLEPQFGWSLYDPSGRLIYECHPPKPGEGINEGHVAITMAMLDAVRDLQGFVKQPWRLQITNEWPYTYQNVVVSGRIIETSDASGAPLVSGTVSLAAGVAQTIPFDLNRLGSLQVGVGVPQGSSAIVDVSVVIPSQAVVASGFNQVDYNIGLVELHNAQKVSGQWALKLQSSTAVTCNVTAQVYDFVTIPMSVLQSRLDAFLGTNGTNVALTTEYDSNTKHSFLCFIINDLNFLEFLDSMGVVDDLESSDATLRNLPPPQPGAAVATPGTHYRVADLGALTIHELGSDHSYYLANFQTSYVKITCGTNNSLAPALHVAIGVAGNPSIDIDGLPDVELSNVSIAFDLVPALQPAFNSITLTPQIPVTNPPSGIQFHYNINDAPDWLADVNGDIQSKFNSAMQSLGSYMSTFVPHMFFQFMGAGFDFVGPGGPLWVQNGAYNFMYIAGDEDPPGALSPYYHPGGPETMTLGNTVAAAVAPASATPGATAGPGTSAPVAVARTVSTVGTSGISVLNPKPNWISPNLSKIDHIVVLLKENRSFDHMLGYLSIGEPNDVEVMAHTVANLPVAGRRTDVDGLTPEYINLPAVGSRPRPYPLVPVGPNFPPDYFPFDPDHSYNAVANEIGNPGGPPMYGFVAQFIRDYPFLAWDQATRTANGVDARFMPFGPDAVMGYHTPATVPYYDYLAANYTICDRWFSSHPGPTFPNRFFFLSGKLNSNRFGEPEIDNVIADLTFDRHRTIFDELTARGISWTYYESPPDVTMLRMFARYAFDDQNIRPISEFFTRAQSAQLPSVTFIDPNFHYGTTNDDHPPTSVTYGQQLVQQIVEALSSNLSAWAKTLFIVSYDEHGSIFDHVVPPIAETLSEGGPNPPRPIEIEYGVRVPTFVISPWVEAICSKTVFDHCSILKTIIARFCPDDPPILSDRVAFAADVGPLLSRDRLPLNVQGVTTNIGNEMARASVPASAPASGTAVKAAAAASIASGVLVDAGKVVTAGGAVQAGTANVVSTAAGTARSIAVLPRAAELFSPGADWHNYIARLKQMVSG